MDAVSWIMPNHEPGKPIQSRSQPSVTCSSSVSAGAVFQRIPFALSPAASISPKIPGPDDVFAK